MSGEIIPLSNTRLVFPVGGNQPVCNPLFCECNEGAFTEELLTTFSLGK